MVTVVTVVAPVVPAVAAVVPAVAVAPAVAVPLVVYIPHRSWWEAVFARRLFTSGAFPEGSFNQACFKLASSLLQACFKLASRFRGFTGRGERSNWAVALGVHQVIDRVEVDDATAAAAEELDAAGQRAAEIARQLADAKAKLQPAAGRSAAGQGLRASAERGAGSRRRAQQAHQATRARVSAGRVDERRARAGRAGCGERSSACSASCTCAERSVRSSSSRWRRRQWQQQQRRWRRRRQRRRRRHRRRARRIIAIAPQSIVSGSSVYMSRTSALHPRLASTPASACIAE